MANNITNTTKKKKVKMTDVEGLQQALHDLQVGGVQLVDNLITDDATKALTARQGKVLKGLIDKINTVLQSNDTDLDTVQEIVNFIKQNKTLLSQLGIGNIVGLQAALDQKLNKTDVVNTLTSTDATKPLSANQGKVLNDAISALTNGLSGLKFKKLQAIISAGTKTAEVSDAFVTDETSVFGYVLKGVPAGEIDFFVSAGKVNIASSDNENNLQIVMYLVK